MLYPLSYGRTWKANMLVYQRLRALLGIVVAQRRVLYRGVLCNVCATDSCLLEPPHALLESRSRDV